MITTILSFLGGSVFRMLWGEISSWINKRQDHAQEIERMRLQAELDAGRHEREQEAIKTQAALNIQVVRVQGEQAIGEVEANGWLEAVRATGKSIGVAWVDAWNAVIRPALATWSVAMITAHYAGWIKLDDNGWQLAGAILGIYVADRALFKRGK
jgi:hypothetical protein